MLDCPLFMVRVRETLWRNCLDRVSMLPALTWLTRVILSLSDNSDHTWVPDPRPFPHLLHTHWQCSGCRSHRDKWSQKWKKWWWLEEKEEPCTGTTPLVCTMLRDDDMVPSWVSPSTARGGQGSGKRWTHSKPASVVTLVTEQWREISREINNTILNSAFLESWRRYQGYIVDLLFIHYDWSCKLCDTIGHIPSSPGNIHNAKCTWEAIRTLTHFLYTLILFSPILKHDF